jgi:hypothetical protein
MQQLGAKIQGCQSDDRVTSYMRYWVRLVNITCISRDWGAGKKSV